MLQTDGDRDEDWSSCGGGSVSASNRGGGRQAPAQSPISCRRTKKGLTHLFGRCRSLGPCLCATYPGWQSFQGAIARGLQLVRSSWPFSHVCVCVCETPVPKGSFGSFDLWSRAPCGLLIQKYLEIGDGTPDEDASHERNCLRISMPKLECECFVLVLVLPQNQVCVGTASGLRSVS